MDIKMNYIERGKGEPLIMLHGNGEDSTYFKEQIKYFSKQYRCIAIDSRAHGKTPRGEAPLTIRQMAQDVCDFMDELGIEKANFIGFSDGGNIMLILAMTHPEKINKMVVDGANLDLDGVDLGAVNYVRSEYAKASVKADSDPAEKLKMEILGLMVNDPDLTPEDLEVINVPTLVMAGTKDLILPQHTITIAARIKGSKLEFIEGDHYIAKENPDEFNAAVDKFFKA